MSEPQGRTHNFGRKATLAHLPYAIGAHGVFAVAASATLPLSASRGIWWLAVSALLVSSIVLTAWGRRTLPGRQSAQNAVVVASSFLLAALPGLVPLCFELSGATPQGIWLGLLGTLSAVSAYLWAPHPAGVATYLFALWIPATVGPGIGLAGLVMIIASTLIARLAHQEVHRYAPLSDQIRTLEETQGAMHRPYATDFELLPAAALATLDLAEDGLIVCDGNLEIKYANQKGAHLLAHGLTQTGSRNLEDLALYDTVTHQELDLRDLAPAPGASGAQLDERVGLGSSRTDGSEPGGPRIDSETVFSLEMHRLPSQEVVVRLRDVTEQKMLRDLMTLQSTRDPLTGLVNRDEFLSQLRQLTLAVVEGRTESATVGYLDLAHLEAINDACGHRAGDQLLQRLTAELRGEMRSVDTIARLGGDHFALLLPQCVMPEAKVIAQRLLEVVRAHRFPWDGQLYAIGASMGLAPILPDTGHYSEPFRAARAACQLALEQGGDRVRIHDANEVEVPRQDELNLWMQRVREAVEESRFELLVQPIVAVAEAPAGTGSKIAKEPPHAELLVRMLDDRGNLVAPYKFIAAAEHFNLMPSIDRWVIQRTLALLADPSSSLTGIGMCAMNLSGRSISDPYLLEEIIALFEKTKVAPNRVCFEITETAMVDNLDAGKHFVSRLREVGCYFALDDFGTGLSSYRYLRSLPVDYLKIDGAFVRGIEGNPDDRAVVESINHVGHRLGLKTIAEFVETPGALAVLKELGVDYAQGSLIGSPTPVS